MKPWFMPKKRIERRAEALLGEYFSVAGGLSVPIPVESILERHLGLSLGFEDLAARLGRADVLGATWIEAKEVAIDASLDPDVYPEAEGRFRFTVAHEIGHYLLHASAIHGYAASHAPLTLRRSKKNPIEWQADFFASCLLMPAAAVIAQWDDVVSRVQPAFAVPAIAQRFAVSEQAMTIRLTDLGLIRDDE